MIEPVAGREHGDVVDLDVDHRAGRDALRGPRRVARHRVQRHRAALADGGRAPAERVQHEQVVDQRRDAAGVAVDDLEELLADVGVDAAAEQGLGVAGDRRHRRAQLVRRVRQELAPHRLERAQPRHVVQHRDRAAIVEGAGARADGPARELELRVRRHARDRRLDELRERRRHLRRDERLGSGVDQHHRTAAIDDDHALDEAVDDGLEQVALLGQLGDPRLHLARHLRHRARQHAELAALVHRRRHVVVALGEQLGRARHRLQRPRDRADEDPREQQAADEPEARADEQAISHARARREHVVERDREPDHAAELVLHRDDLLRRATVDELADAGADLAAPRLRHLVRLADRPADRLVVVGVTLDDAVGADDRDARVGDVGEPPGEAIGVAGGLEPVRDRDRLPGHALVERLEQVVRERALDPPQGGSTDDDDQQEKVSRSRIRSEPRITRHT